MATSYSSDEEQADSQNLVTCDNYLEHEGFILNPNVFCVPCLEGQQRNPGKAFCAHKDCLRQHQVTIDAAPSALGDLKMCCDACAKKKGEMFMTAKVYCVQCDMRYCNDHHKVHDELNTHRMMRIKGYLQSSFAHELRYCKIHRQEAYSLGCPDCSQIFCTECVNTVGVCQDGSPHRMKLVSLKKLSEDIKSSVEPLKIKAEDKFDEISAVTKEITIRLSEWDIETDDGVRFLRRTRDEQLDAIREKYSKLEEDYIISRKSSEEKITGYLAKKAAVIQSEFLTQLKKLRMDITYRHPVDLVTERAEIEKKIAELMKEGFPELALQNQLKFAMKDEEKREIEMELHSTDDVIIGGHIAPPPITPPTGLELIREVKVGGQCKSVCHYKGYTYVGLEGTGIDRIDDQGNVTSELVKTTSTAVSIQAYNDRLYVLVHGEAHYKVCVYDLTGQLIFSWDPEYTKLDVRSRASIISKQLVAADPLKQRITLYTLNGVTAKRIPCSLISKGELVAICERGDDSVVITDEDSSKVFKLNPTSGEVEWVSAHVQKPVGVICYGGEYVLVTSRGKQTKVWILDLKDGKLVGELAAQEVRRMDASTYDLCTNGDTLIVPRFGESYAARYDMR